MLMALAARMAPLPSTPTAVPGRRLARARSIMAGSCVFGVMGRMERGLNKWILRRRRRRGKGRQWLLSADVLMAVDVSAEEKGDIMHFSVCR